MTIEADANSRSRIEKDASNIGFSPGRRDAGKSCRTAISRETDCRTTRPERQIAWNNLSRRLFDNFKTSFPLSPPRANPTMARYNFGRMRRRQ
jgi:hypothetical protein